MHIGLSEIILILVIAVIVTKPERLPSVMLNVGRFVKSITGTLNKLKNELNMYFDNFLKTKKE